MSEESEVETAPAPKTTETNKDKIRLKLLLTNGKTHEFYFTPATTASDIGKHVYENWPEDWGDKVDNHRILRLIYQGRFLHGDVSLGGLKLVPGQRVAMHLIPRENLPTTQSQAERNREKSRESRCHNCCNIF